MDIPRPSVARQKRIRRTIFAVVGLIVLVLVTVALAQLKPAAPTVEFGSVWPDSVKRGSMLRQVRGPGTLVPEDIRWIPAVTEGRVERRLALPGTVVEPSTVILELSDPRVQQEALDAEYQLRGAEAAARAIGVQLEAVPVRTGADLGPALKALRGVDGVLNADTPLFVTNRARLVGAVAESRLPAIYPARVYVEAGGLASYGPNVPELWKGAAVYVDKILKGARPGDLPVEQPTTFELTINNRTASAIGLTIPQPVVLRADRIVE